MIMINDNIVIAAMIANVTCLLNYYCHIPRYRLAKKTIIQHIRW